MSAPWLPDQPEVMVVGGGPSLAVKPLFFGAEPGLDDVQFPGRKGWHTDQSFRRPPPDGSLFQSRWGQPFELE